MLLPTTITPRHPCIPTKPAHLERKAEAAGRILRAISNPRRLILLHYMAEREMSVNQLAQALGLSQSATSQHLSTLQKEELVARRRAGQTVYYSLASERVRKLLNSLLVMV